MKLLRDLILIKQEDAVTEKKTESGLILLSTQSNLYQIGDDESKVKDLIYRPKMNKGVILEVGNGCLFFKKGDTVIYRKETESYILDVEEERCAILKEKNVLVKISDGKLIPNPDYVLVKITKEARESLFNKKIKTDDGREVLLFVAGDKGADDESMSQYFVSCGEIVSVGSNVKEIQPGDLGLIEYVCDNDPSIIVGYDGEDKIIAVRAVTTYCNKEHKISGGNKTRDQIVSSAGDYEELASLYGAFHGEKLIAVEPFVFLNYEDNKQLKVNAGGILYEDTQKMIVRKILSASPNSKENYNIKEGDNVLVDDFDIFTIEYNGAKVTAINDVDVKCNERWFPGLKLSQ